MPIDRDAPVGALEGDLEFLMRAVQKVEQIREDLGKVGPVIADQVDRGDARHAPRGWIRPAPSAGPSRPGAC